MFPWACSRPRTGLTQTRPSRAVATIARSVGAFITPYAQCMVYLPTKLGVFWGKCWDSYSIHGAYGNSNFTMVYANNELVFMGFINKQNLLAHVVFFFPSTPGSPCLLTEGDNRISLDARSSISVEIESSRSFN